MEWSESIEIDAPLEQVRRAVADVREVARWSTWPEASAYHCSDEVDGTAMGSEIVFTDDDGHEQGRQRLVYAEHDRVDYALTIPDPAGQPISVDLAFRLDNRHGMSTRVHLDFEVHLDRPFVIRSLAERKLARHVRPLHIRELEVLKAHIEGVDEW